MKFIKVKKEFPKKWLETYEKKNHKKYKRTFEDDVPLYLMVDENYEPILKEEKQWNEKGEKWDRVKVKQLLNQAQLQNLIRMGQKVEIFTRQQIEKEKQEFEALINSHVKQAEKSWEKERKELLEKIKKYEANK